MKIFLLLLFIQLVSGCKKSFGLHEVFEKDQIQCGSNVTNCPEELVVYTVNKKSVNKKTRFKYHPLFKNNEETQKLQFKMIFDWCSKNTFNEEKTYVKVSVREPLPEANPLVGFLMFILFIVFMFQ
jgi:hypothetical protein